MSKKRILTKITKTSVDNSLWIEKHAPKTIEELVINKKKVQEFIDIVEENGGGGILVLHGPPGSCKNALINAFCSQKSVKLVRFTDTKT